MEITICDKNLIINNEFKIENILDQINIQLSENNNYLSHIIVDGIEVYDDIPLYLEENFNNISKIEVISKTEEQFIQELMLSIESYLTRAIPEVGQLSTDLYNNDAEVWNKISQLFEGISWIHQAIYSIDHTKIISDWDKCIVQMVSLEEKLNDFEEALVNKDIVLLGDIVKYELYELLVNLNQELTEIIDKEVKRINVS